MRLLLDFLPILLFFGSYRLAENHKDWAAAFATDHFGALTAGGVVGPAEAPVILATIVVIAATLAQVIVLKATRRHVDAMLWVSLVLVVVFGGLTVYFHNDTFIKWKPSVLYWTMGLVLWLAPLVAGKNVLKLLMGGEIDLPAKVWHRLNFVWIAFFAGLGLLNLWVAYTFSTDAWVTFKSFGIIGLLLAFMVAQGVYISRHLDK
jgi:intracellular septation protein